MPTVVICLDTRYRWDFSNEQVEVEYGVNLGTSYARLIVNTTVDAEKANDSVILYQLTRKCFKIKSVTDSKKVSKNDIRKIRISFKVKETDIPPSIRLYFTSEENHYGIFDKDWYDGKVFEKRMNLNHLVDLKIEPKKYEYLNQGQQCRYFMLMSMLRLISKSS